MSQADTVISPEFSLILKVSRDFSVNLTEVVLPTWVSDLIAKVRSDEHRKMLRVYYLFHGLALDDTALKVALETYLIGDLADLYDPISLLFFDEKEADETLRSFISGLQLICSAIGD